MRRAAERVALELRSKVGLLVALGRPPLLPANGAQLARRVDATRLAGTPARGGEDTGSDRAPHTGRERRPAAERRPRWLPRAASYMVLLVASLLPGTEPWGPPDRAGRHVAGISRFGAARVRRERDRHEREPPNALSPLVVATRAVAPRSSLRLARLSPLAVVSSCEPTAKQPRANRCEVVTPCCASIPWSSLPTT